MKTAIYDRRKINWRRVGKYVKGIFPQLEEDVRKSFSYLETVEPALVFEEFPPRILLGFIPKGREEANKPKTENYPDLLGYQEKELRKKQMETSELVGKIAERNNLIVIGGHIVTRYAGLTRKKSEMRRELVHGLGFYTFKPRYGEFEK